MRSVCRNCGWGLVVSHGRCKPCHQYWERHGVERPEELIVRHGVRVRAEEESRATPMARVVVARLIRGGMAPSRAHRIARQTFIPWVSNACWTWRSAVPESVVREVYEALTGTPAPRYLDRECGSECCLSPQHVVNLTAQRLA